jgi:hypothetical protein
MKRLAPLIAALALLGPAACQKTLQAPDQAGVCFMVSPQKDGSVKFNNIATGIKDLEHCAAQLEIVRLRFQRLGSNQDEMVGAYQGSFLFLRREGIFTSTKIDGIQYPALVRLHGELVVPNAIVEGPPAPPPPPAK